jgi:hypothetical protein
MKKLLLPLVLAILGVVGGAGAGWFLKPAPVVEPEPCLDDAGEPLEPEVCEERRAAEEEAAMAEPAPVDPDAPAPEFFRFDRPFVVPLMGQGRVAALMVASVSIEVETGQLPAVEAREPRLRDAMLRVMFDHAYAGGFDGDFTAAYVMKDLRRNLLAAARKVAGAPVRDVLVVDIYRDDQ